jgi:5'-3' exoribonuclease 2
LSGSNRDVVANRAAIRLANMSAAEVLKAELAGLVPVKPSASSMSAAKVQGPEFDVSDSASDFDVPGLGNVEPPVAASPSLDESMMSVSSGQKRSAADVEAEDAQIDVEEDIVVTGENDSSVEEEEPSYALVVRADGSVEQADNVRYGSTFHDFLSPQGNTNARVILDCMNRVTRNAIISKSLAFRPPTLSSGKCLSPYLLQILL